MIKSDTVDGIENLPVESVLRYVDNSAKPNVPSPRVRLNYIKMLYDVLGYDLSADAALAAVDEPQAELVLSTAGSGKTTWSQIKAIEQKAIRRSRSNPDRKISGSQILCLVYNNHNVGDIKRKHAAMVGRVMSIGIKGLELDTTINACTMHSFCEFIRRMFVARLGLIGFAHMPDEETVRIMRRAVRIEAKVRKTELTASLEKLHALYVLKKETLRDLENLEFTDVFTDVGLDAEVIEAIFNRYDGMKRSEKKFEFIDMLYNIYDLLSKDSSALAEVQKYYEYVIADEVQDFTPLMWRLLELFVNNGTPLTCIGDEDQNIYAFRGADIEDTLHFKEAFCDAKVYLMAENRRCPVTILNEAKRVISGNSLRFNKKIRGKKDGGQIDLVPYNTVNSQMMNLVRDLKKLSLDEQNNSVVCYRNTDCSMLIADVLAESGIPINCMKSFMPYSHELYKHVIGIYNALEMACDRNVFKVLWKVLPCRKSDFYEAIGYSEETNRFTVPDNKQHFARYNYGKLMSYRGFTEALGILEGLADGIGEDFLKDTFPVVMRMLSLYFWNFRKGQKTDREVAMDEIFEQRIKEKFTVEKTFNALFSEIQHVKSMCSSNVSVGAGVCLSTFHSLKGLEFDHVFATFMDDETFPNFSLIEYKKYPPDVERGLKEAETRLWYVAITRAKKDVTVYYDEVNPSRYVREYREFGGTAQEDPFDELFDNSFALPPPVMPESPEPFAVAEAEPQPPPEPVVMARASAGYVKSLFNELFA